MVYVAIFYEQSSLQDRTVVSFFETALRQFQPLKVFDLSCGHDHLSYHALCYLIEALTLTGHVGVCQVLRNVKFWRNACTTLSTIIQNSATNLAALSLNSSQFDDYGARILPLPFSLKYNNMLRELILYCNEAFTEIGWGST